MWFDTGLEIVLSLGDFLGCFLRNRRDCLSPSMSSLVVISCYELRFITCKHAISCIKFVGRRWIRYRGWGAGYVDRSCGLITFFEARWAHHTSEFSWVLLNKLSRFNLQTFCLWFMLRSVFCHPLQAYAISESVDCDLSEESSLLVVTVHMRIYFWLTYLFERHLCFKAL